MKWYVVVDDYCTNPHPDDAVWTISRNSSEPGWNTDSGFCGYGLVRVDAEELANAANEIERLRTALEEIRDAGPMTLDDQRWRIALVALGGDK